MPEGTAISPFYLTQGVLLRRILAYFLDLIFIALLFGVLVAAAFLLTILSFGLLHFVWAILPFTAIIYSTLTIGSPAAATWGMRIAGLTYRRLDGRRVDYAQALVATLLFYISVGLTGGLILLLPLVTGGHRMFHDILTGIILIRTHAQPGY